MNKIRHHIIPIMFLKNFCDEKSRIWVYDKTNPSKGLVASHPKNTAIQNYFYSIHLDNGAKDSNTIEDVLAEVVEGPAVAALKSLKACNLPSHEGRQRLAFFFGILFSRSQAYREAYEDFVSKFFNPNSKLQNIAQNPENFARWADDYERKHGQPMADNIEELRQEILAGAYKLKISSNLGLKKINEVGEKMADHIADMIWTIIKAPAESYFLTADNPILVSNIELQELLIPNWSIPSLLDMKDSRTEIFIPISKTIGLLASNNANSKAKDSIIDGDPSFVKKKNRALAQNATRFVYSPSADYDFLS